ncbi:hypothetical protein MRX96_027500 [Rhipicephalus microplus]
MLNRIKCHRYWKPKRREARSDGDEFLGKMKPSAVSAKPITLHPSAASLSAEAGVALVTASSEASTSSPIQDAATTTASSQQQQTSESGRNQAECKDLWAILHRTKCRWRRKPKCRQARSDDDDFLDEVKSSTASVNITAFRPRAASPSAEAGVPLVTASSEASTSSPLEDAATTTASSQQQQTSESGRNQAECKDLRAKVHRTKCRWRRKPKCRQARSDDDDFFGEVKSSTASANITAFRPRVALPSAEAGNCIRCHRHSQPKCREAGSDADDFLGEVKSTTASVNIIAIHPRAASSRPDAGVPLVTASSEASTSSPLEDAATTTASSQQQQTSESGRNQAECKDLRAKVHRTKCRWHRKPNCRQARSDDDDFLGEVKSSTASANITALRPRATSPSAMAGVPLVPLAPEAKAPGSSQRRPIFAHGEEALLKKEPHRLQEDERRF